MHGESAAKPAKPKDLRTPGLAYRPRQGGWILLWSPRSDLVVRGYQKTTYRLWPPSGLTTPPPEPGREDWEAISGWCERYQAEMLRWAGGGVQDDPKSVFDGTISALIKIYQTHERSPFGRLRYETKRQYTYQLARIDEAVGSRRITSLTFEDLMRWYEEFSEPDELGGHEKFASAKLLTTRLALVFSFCALVLPKSSGCSDIVAIFTELNKQNAFPGGRLRRTEFLVYNQAEAICAEANRRGAHSIALAQALQFECGVRQKDVIGEWVPRSEPGVTDVHYGLKKWLMGARWEEIDDNFIWTHRLSKSVKGRKNIMRADVGKTEKFDLKAFPLVVAQLQLRWKPPGALDSCRGDFPAHGPLIIHERTRRPWIGSKFSNAWRDIARAVGVPDDVQNRDSRAGAATEADTAGVPIEKAQRLLGHSRKETTGIYQRDGMAIRSEIAQLRAEKRK